MSQESETEVMLTVEKQGYTVVWKECPNCSRMIRFFLSEKGSIERVDDGLRVDETHIVCGLCKSRLKAEVKKREEN